MSDREKYDRKMGDSRDGGGGLVGDVCLGIEILEVRVTVMIQLDRTVTAIP